MKLHELHSPAGARKERTRVGRGIAAGQGKTSGRGQKGAGSRQGAKTPKGFEGGQLPLQKRLPYLRGFTNKWRTEYAVVNVGKLNRFEKNSIVDAVALANIGLVPRAGDPIKVLGAGKLKVSVTLRVHRASAAATAAVEAAGGRVELLEDPSQRYAGKTKRAPGGRALTAKASKPTAESDDAEGGAESEA